MASTTARSITATPAAQPSSLPDDLLEDIFLRLGDAADLTRAYASCFTFRRIVSGRHFLRRYRSLHRPPVVCFLASGSPAPGYPHPTFRFHPAEPPHRSAPAAGVARAADFALAFLSDPIHWRVRDVRDGRILLSRKAISGDAFEELIVYDPLHRRHIQIGPIPRDLDPPSDGIIFNFKHYEPFLDPATDKEKETEDEDLPLRVICNVVTNEEIRTFVFSSVTGKWRAVTSFAIIGTNFRWLSYLVTLRHYSCRSFCWTMYGRKTMLVLDTREMKFSVVDLPSESYYRMHIVVEAGEGRLGLLILGTRMLFLYSKSWPSNNGDGVEDWRYDDALPLVDRYWSFSSGGDGGYALLKGDTQYNINDTIEKKSETQYFIVEIKTMLIRRLCSMKHCSIDAPSYYLYASFPPPLSLPSL